MKLKSLLILAFAALISIACDKSKIDPPTKDDNTQDQAVFAKGADIGWYTEMESKGYRFYTSEGAEMDCPALMKSLGFNSLRFRVWVNPENGWNGKDDLLKKCLRAKELEMNIMIDFHYSDSWADPGKQNIPQAWKDYDLDKLASAVADHTSDVLNMLKSKGIDVAWVQVGNEVTNGMLWEVGRVKDQNAAGFSKLFKAGADKVRAIYPNAKVILHIDNAWKMDTLNWFYGLMANVGLQYDMIGLSLYPSYWENGGYPDWSGKVNKAIANVKTLAKTYKKDVMLVEFGMPASDPQASKSALETVLKGLKAESSFKGLFYWEPESEKSRNGYDYGAFQNGKPTIALDPFRY